MDSSFRTNTRIVTISGMIATGTTTLAKNLSRMINWKYVNVGALQREFDRKHHIHENMHGAASRTDDHERSMEAMTTKMLNEEKGLIYEAWLAGFVAQNIKGVFKVLLICSHEDIRIDRVVNRENITVEQAKKWIFQREEENIKKWKKLYGDYEFWNPKYYDLIADTYTMGPMQTAGRVLDALAHKK